MKTRQVDIFFLSIVCLALIAGCSLNAQKAKEKTAFNNFMQALKGTAMMEGKVGNVKYQGNEISFDVLDSSLPQDQIQKICGEVFTMYINESTNSQTGVTVLKAYVSMSGSQILKMVYQAGPAAKAEDLIKFTWTSGTTPATPTPSGTTTPGATTPAPPPPPSKEGSGK
jgi:hypothetical protein